jgi:hypothetical protein
MGLHGDALQAPACVLDLLDPDQPCGFHGFIVARLPSPGAAREWADPAMLVAPMPATRDD